MWLGMWRWTDDNRKLSRAVIEIYSRLLNHIGRKWLKFSVVSCILVCLQTWFAFIETQADKIFNIWPSSNPWYMQWWPKKVLLFIVKSGDFKLKITVSSFIISYPFEQDHRNGVIPVYWRLNEFSPTFVHKTDKTRN